MPRIASRDPIPDDVLDEWKIPENRGVELIPKMEWKGKGKAVAQRQASYISSDSDSDTSQSTTLPSPQSLIAQVSQVNKRTNKGKGKKPVTVASSDNESADDVIHLDLGKPYADIW